MYLVPCPPIPQLNFDEKIVIASLSSFSKLYNIEEPLSLWQQPQTQVCLNVIKTINLIYYSIYFIYIYFVNILNSEILHSTNKVIQQILFDDCKPLIQVKCALFRFVFKCIHWLELRVTLCSLLAYFAGEFARYQKVLIN